jgi:outer membrane receptor protein involved in Fe transport
MVVTGSRIRRKDLAGPAPLVTFSREQIIASGRTNVGEFLQTLPEQSNAANRAVNNGGDGSVRVNLRGLGERLTLVLLNGRRLPPGGTGADDSADLTAIPTSMIERIEVLKDGASAIYGSDAVGGVINLITRKRFDGAEANVYGSTSTHGDGQQIDASALVGTTGDKGSVLASFAYYNGAPVWSGNRPFSSVGRALLPSGKERLQGSSTIPGSNVKLSASQRGVPNGNDQYNSLVTTYPTATGLTRDPVTGQFRNYRGNSTVDGDGWNTAPYNYLVTPQERFNLFSSGEYNVSKAARLYYDAFYTKRNSTQTLAPEPLQLDLEGITLSANSIYNPFGKDLNAVARRLVEFGRRSYTENIHTFHLTMGIDGELPSSAGPFASWYWDASFNFNRNQSTTEKVGTLRASRLRNAVGPSFVDATGAPRCGTPGAPIDGCVPLNLLGGAGSITRDQIESLRFTGVQRGVNQMIGAQASLSGTLFRLWAEREVGVALGYEFRRLSGEDIPDPVTVAGETTGNKAEITQGSYNVHEAYAELSLPLVEKRLLLEALELTAAARASFYSSFGDTFNYKFGARWAPIQDFALRGTYSTAFRAPAVPELYLGNSDSFDSAVDPCGKNVQPGSPLARSCGAAANNGDDSSQQRARWGGNPQLDPETAKIFTLGLVVRPRVAKNLSLTFDYFNTDITKTIDRIGTDIILQGCYPGSAGVAPKYCDLITRDPQTQRISRVINLYNNVGRDKVDGLDMIGQLDLTTAAGSFNLLAAVTYLHRFDRTLADGTIVKGAGTADLDAAFPHFRFNAGVRWQLSGWSAALNTFFIGSYRECADGSGTFQSGGLCYAPDHAGERAISASSTWDAVLGYSFQSSAGRSNVLLGMTNIFDAKPPLSYTTSSVNLKTYDQVGRQVYARVSHQF